MALCAYASAVIRVREETENEKIESFGVLKDIKSGEYRVVLTPAEVRELTGTGVKVYVASGAGFKAGFNDDDYASAGAVVTATNEEIWAACDFVAKVKEIEPSEYDLIRSGQIIFCCIHPAAHPEEVGVLLDKKVVAITAEDSHRFGSPNCEAAGRGDRGRFPSGNRPLSPLLYPSSLVPVVHFFREAHYIFDFYLCAVIEHRGPAHPAEDLMLIGHDYFEVQICRSVQHRFKFHLKPPVR